MNKCPFNDTCSKPYCNTSCGKYSEYNHWLDRCSIALSNPIFLATKRQLREVYSIVSSMDSPTDPEDSSFVNLKIVQSSKQVHASAILSYALVTMKCTGIGFYNGVYRLDFAKYIADIKESWNSRNTSTKFEDTNIWIKSAKYLVIYNLDMVRFKDFESQTLLTILQDRYDIDKFTTIVLGKNKQGLQLYGEPSSVFFLRLRDEIMMRGGLTIG